MILFADVGLVDVGPWAATLVQTGVLGWYVWYDLTVRQPRQENEHRAHIESIVAQQQAALDAAEQRHIESLQQCRSDSESKTKHLADTYTHLYERIIREMSDGDERSDRREGPGA